MESFANTLQEEKNDEIIALREKITRLEAYIEEMKMAHLKAMRWVLFFKKTIILQFKFADYKYRTGKDSVCYKHQLSIWKL